MSAVALLSEAMAAGVTFKTAAPDRLRVEAPRRPPDDLLARLRASKPELLRLLSAGIPDDWLDGVARLRSMPCPAAIRAADWQAIIERAERHLDVWGARLAALGWHTLDVFGAHSNAPLARYDCMGLVLLLDRHELIAATSDAATLRTATRAIQTYCRRHTHEPGAVALWELEPVQVALNAQGGRGGELDKT